MACGASKNRSFTAFQDQVRQTDRLHRCDRLEVIQRSRALRRQAIHAALLSAFPSRAKLAQMVQHGLGENLFAAPTA